MTVDSRLKFIFRKIIMTFLGRNTAINRFSMLQIKKITKSCGTVVDVHLL